MTMSEDISKRLEKRKERLRAKIDELIKMKDEIIAAQIERVSRYITAAQEAKIDYLKWRLSQIEKKEETGLTRGKERVYHYRYFYYRRLGFSEGEARAKAEEDAKKYEREIREVLGMI